MRMHVYAYINKLVIKLDNIIMYFFSKVMVIIRLNIYFFEKYPKVTVKNRSNIYIMNICHHII